MADEGVNGGRPVDRDGFWEAFDDDAELAREMTELFLETAPAHVTGLEAAIEAGDTATADRAAHTLKGLFATFHAEEARESARAVELAAKDNDLSRARAALPSLRQQMDRVLRDLGTILGEMDPG